MAGPRTPRIQWVLAVALVLGGTWLLYVGASYVSAWLTYEAERSALLNAEPACGFCKVTFGLAPTPGWVSVSYLVAVPAILGIAWWTRRGSWRHRPGGRTVTALPRAGGDTLLAAMGWMVFLYALALAWPGGPLLAPGGGLPIPGSLFLLSLLVVPILVVGVGLALLWDHAYRQFVAPGRAAGE